MLPRRVLPILLSLSAAIAGTGARAPAQNRDALDKAFDAYWKAGDARDAGKAAERILKAGVDFETAWSRLKAGRTYAHEKTGELSWHYPAADGAAFENRVVIPDDYDPARRWMVRVQLHGGVARAAPNLDTGAGRRGGRGGGQNRIAGESQIYVLPSAWNEATWWHTVQMDNIRRLLDRLKRHYNVDESHVYVTGVSDGGTGAYYIAMRDTTPWSAFLPLNGSIIVLTNPDVGANGNLHASNLVNKPLFIVNGGRDPLYPVAHVQTHIEVLNTLGVPLVFRPQPNAGHDTTWWAAERPAFEEFVHTHPRAPHPERVSWEADRTDRENRAHWLVINGLGARPSDKPFDEIEFLPHPRRSGRVDAVRRGNTIEAQSRGVAEFTLLLSPDVFDFSRPVTVSLNGRHVFEGAVRKDPAVLLEWAARDDDRTMLYGAALKIRVP